MSDDQVPNHFDAVDRACICESNAAAELERIFQTSPIAYAVRTRFRFLPEHELMRILVIALAAESDHYKHAMLRFAERQSLTIIMPEPPLVGPSQG
jgi:hypothetical protein